MKTAIFCEPGLTPICRPNWQREAGFKVVAKLENDFLLLSGSLADSVSDALPSFRAKADLWEPAIFQDVFYTALDMPTDNGLSTFNIAFQCKLE